jgi:hypothetical protein
VDILLVAATPVHETAHYKTRQAVIECGSDAKIVERRGEVYRLLQNLGACFRKFLTAELPQAPQFDQARCAIFKQSPQRTKARKAIFQQQTLNPN